MAGTVGSSDSTLLAEVYPPLDAAAADTTPGKPAWLTVAMHVQPPPLAASWQVAESKPSPVSGELRPEHWRTVPERILHPAGRSSSSVPVVVVPSVYVPSELAVHVPLTLRDPVIVTFLQLPGSRPAAEMSRSLLLRSRHAELAVQVPTTLPPQAVTFVHDVPPPPVPPLALPPVPTEPPLPPVLELPPVPEGLFEPVLEQANPRIVRAVIRMRGEVRCVMEEFSSA